MDQTLTPSRQLILSDMRELIESLDQDIIVVSGSSTAQMPNQLEELHSYRLGQNGNHALAPDGSELWNFTLTDAHRDEIHEHIQKLISLLDHELNHDWVPIEDRGGQITFSPIGNQAPVEKKKIYDPDKLKRFALMEQVPFESEELIVKIGGSTSLDYMHKDKHKGTNVQKLIEHMNWNKDECIYFGDGLYPGGNDEAVIGVIETIAVADHLDTHAQLLKLFGEIK